MKNHQQKEESSYVKRIKLKKSIIKTHQILKSISPHQAEVQLFKPQQQPTGQKGADLYRKLKISSRGKHITLDTCIYTHQLNPYKFNQLHTCDRTFETRMFKHAQNRLGNIQIRRIVGDPYHKRQTTNMENKMAFKISGKLLNDSSFATLSVQRQGVGSFVESERPSTYKSQIYSANSLENRYLGRQSKSKQASLIKVNATSRKDRTYLYQRMAQTESKHRDQSNGIYEKRIKSYLQFLWRGMLAHNIYLNLDLTMPQISMKRLKAYVGPGNNCNMIKGLLKRRYWWTITEELTDDCLFVWTQLKINKIFEKQEKGIPAKSIYVVEEPAEDRKSLIKTSAATRKRHTIQTNGFKVKEKAEMKEGKFGCLLSQQDKKVLVPFFQKYSSLEEKQKWSTTKIKEQTYLAKTSQIVQHCKHINILTSLKYQNQKEQQSKGCQQTKKALVHNHLQNNFHLGNKKALFYNLQQYYKKVGEDIFHYVPLTFHIKDGFRDKQYKRFIQFYERRAKLIKKQEETQEGTSKTRNIWIVKPGQNSNQGRGISVIDEIYELNNIIKQTDRAKNSKDQKQASNDKTYIVQMYLDRPFLYNERKFDIRHYMLITNLYGVTRAYWYEQGYIRTSSYHFNIHNFDPEIHLTNDAIQKHFPDYGRYQSANKLSYAELQNYLNTFTERRYNFKEQILPKMKKIAKDSVRSIYTKMAPHNQLNNFQIFGLDFMIDRTFKPWLIEINTNPCLDCVCPLLDKIIPYMVEQSLKLSLDLVHPPPHHYPNTAKHYAPLINLQTFKYELIFDSLSEGADLQRLYSTSNKNIINDIGQIQEDEQFNDNGKEIKLDDYT